MADDRLSINVTIDGRNYPMKVNPADEQRIRAAAKNINERLNVYKSKFSGNGKDSFDFLVMVSIDLVSKYMDRESRTDSSDLISELRILSSEVDDYIRKSQAL